MPQEQRQVEVVFRYKPRAQGAATGNNAAWACACGRNQWLIGRTHSPDGATEATRVECPDCRRNYFIVPETTFGTRVMLIRETTWPAEPS